MCVFFFFLRGGGLRFSVSGLGEPDGRTGIGVQASGSELRAQGLRR